MFSLLFHSIGLTQKRPEGETAMSERKVRGGAFGRYRPRVMATIIAYIYINKEKR